MRKNLFVLNQVSSFPEVKVAFISMVMKSKGHDMFKPFIENPFYDDVSLLLDGMFYEKGV
jgi:hypothetical protein